jgi:polyphosphate kinase 2 (PPK2 family)
LLKSQKSRVVEPVNGFCTDQQYETFMGQVNDFERMIRESNAHLIKLYFSIEKEEQARRFDEIRSNPLKKWKMTEVDEHAQELWDRYTEYKLRMFEKTDKPQAPWRIIDANRKTDARIEALEYILDQLPYDS